MQVTETLADGLRRAYAVRVPASELEDKRSAKLRELTRTLHLPGFRPGKVPASLIEKRYGSAVMAEVLQDALSTATDQVIADRNLRPAGQPRVDLVGDPQPTAAPADLEFKVELDLLPEITVPDFAQLALTRLKAQPSEEMVEKALTEMAQRNARFEDEAARPAQTGDFLAVDFAGSIDGVPFAGGEGRDMLVEIGGAGFVPGFSEGLAGMIPGESRRVEVDFPADYPSAEVAGKHAVFEVTAKGLKQRVVPAVDDAFADSIGAGDLAELRETMTRAIQRDYDGRARLRLKRELLDALAEHTAFLAPQNLVDAEFGAIWRQVEAELKAGRLDDEDRGKDEATLRAEYREIAERRVKLGLLLAEVGRRAGVQVTEQELNLALRQEVSRYPGQEKQVLDLFRNNPQAVEQLRGPIFEDKTIDYILSLAKVEEREASVEELELPPAEPRLAAAEADSGAEEAGAAEAAEAGETAGV